MCSLTAFLRRLNPSFLVMPRGSGFVSFAEFENGYETLKQSTAGFSQLDPPIVFATALRTPLVLIILRAMLGFTPSEWAYVAGQNSGLNITQGFARTLDRRIRLNPVTALRLSATVEPRLQALIANCSVKSCGSQPRPLPLSSCIVSIRRTRGADFQPRAPCRNWRPLRDAAV